MVTRKKSQPARRATGMPRVTNQDLNDRLIRMEESIKPAMESISRVSSLQEQQIRAEGVSKDHDSKITVLFDKAKETGGDVEKVKQNVAAGRAILGTLATVAAIVMAVIGYFVTQQSGTLRDISDNVSKTAAATIQLDKRLSITEYQLAHTAQGATQAASSAPTPQPDKGALP